MPLYLARGGRANMSPPPALRCPLQTVPLSFLAIKETARLTDERIELGESAVAALDEKLQMLTDMVDAHPEIAVTYFQPDEKKVGGSCVTSTGMLKKIDDYEHALVLLDGKK